MYGSNVCGEGGEYETLTLDCPLFEVRIRAFSTFLPLRKPPPPLPNTHTHTQKKNTASEMKEFRV